MTSLPSASRTVSRPLRQGSAAVLVTCWGAVVVAGLGAMLVYGAEAGAAAVAPLSWPADATLARAIDRPTLVMVVHPRCSCSRASLSELAWLMTRLRDRVRAYVLFTTGAGLDPERSDLFARASGIAGVTVVRDDGSHAELLGARTSGQVYLYDEGGALVFAGGITPSRSHEGDSVGRQRLLSLVRQGDADRPSSDVFGCGLDNGETE